MTNSRWSSKYQAGAWVENTLGTAAMFADVIERIGKQDEARRRIEVKLDEGLGDS